MYIFLIQNVIMQKKKGFKFTTGMYYFNIKTGYNSNITISRNKKEEAVYAFSNYLKQRKECEWLGQWEGNKFVENNFETLLAAS